MKIFKRSAAFILGFFLIAGAAFSQGNMQKQAKPDSISDQQLMNFAAVNQEVQKIRQSSSQKLQSLLADKEIDMQRFQQIMMSKRNPNAADSLKPSKKEQKTMKEIQPKLKKIQQGSRSKMMKVMKDNKMNPQQYQSIMRAVRSNPKVMKRYQKVVQDSSGK